MHLVSKQVTAAGHMPSDGSATELHVPPEPTGELPAPLEVLPPLVDGLPPLLFPAELELAPALLERAPALLFDAPPAPPPSVLLPHASSAVPATNTLAIPYLSKVMIRL